MEQILKIFDSWQVKLLMSTIPALFSPYYMTFTILSILIILDSIVGGHYAYKLRKFTLKRFRRTLTKIIIYATSIFVVILLEKGISGLYDTDAISQLMISYLAITEVMSILRNLTLLGAPLPHNISKLLIKQLAGDDLSELLEEGSEKQEYVTEIMDMINYAIPNVKNEDIQRLLKIKFKEWVYFINGLDVQVGSNGIENGELFYYRVINLMNMTNRVISDKIIEAKIPESCIDCFYKWHKPFSRKMAKSIKDICYSEEEVDKKKNLIIEKIIIGLYQTVTDMQKIEACYIGDDNIEK